MIRIDFASRNLFQEVTLLAYPRSPPYAGIGEALFP